MEKIAIKGNPNNGDKILKYFMSLGATNPLDRNGMSNWYYYIEPCSNIIDVDTIKHFQEYKIYESWEQFENEYLNKNKMEERNIKISLEKAKEWYKQGGELKEVALQAFNEDELKDNFPTSWEEYYEQDYPKYKCNANWKNGSAGYCLFNTKEEAKAFIALGKLIQLRDEYWRLDNNWKPDWANAMTKKYCIYYENDELTTGILSVCNEILTFRTSELRDMFYKNFKDLIEQAKMFL